MKNFLKLSLVICGFALSSFMGSEKATAKRNTNYGCASPGSEICGTTPNGTILFGRCACEN
jgi:hypothetical protein